MRTVLVSAAESGARAFTTLMDLGVDVRAVISLPASRLGNVAGAVRFDALAIASGVPCHAVTNINDAASVALLRELAPELLLVIGWSQIVGDEVLAIPTRAAVGFHPTLLPAHRGRAPLAWTLIHGLERSGVTLFHLAPGVDAGDIIGQVEFPIGADTTARELYDVVLGALETLVRTWVPRLADGTAPRRPQDHARATYWPRRRPEDGGIDWCWDARRLHNWVRGLGEPYPGAFTSIRGEKVIVWSARLVDVLPGEPGTVLEIGDRDVTVATGHGALVLSLAQGRGDVAPAAAVLRAVSVRVGDRFESVDHATVPEAVPA